MESAGHKVDDPGRATEDIFIHGDAFQWLRGRQLFRQSNSSSVDPGHAVEFFLYPNCPNPVIPSRHSLISLVFAQSLEQAVVQVAIDIQK